MKRNRLSSRKRMSSDATELGRLAIGLAESGANSNGATGKASLSN